MSSFIPMVSSSPPPLDDDGRADDDYDNDEFGNFTGADDSGASSGFHGNHKHNPDIVYVHSENDQVTELESSQKQVNSLSDTKDASPKQVDVDFTNVSQFSKPEDENSQTEKGISERGIMDGFDDGEDEIGPEFVFISTDVKNKLSDLKLDQGDIHSTYASSPSGDDENFVTNKESSQPADGVVRRGSMTDSGLCSSDISPVQQSTIMPEFSTKTISDDGDDTMGDEETNSTASSRDKSDKFVEDISSSEPSVSEGYMSHSNVTPTDQEKNILDSEPQYFSENLSENFNDDDRYNNNPDIPFVRSNESGDLEMNTYWVNIQNKNQLEQSHNDAFDDDDFQDFSSHSVNSKSLSEIHSSIGTNDSRLEVKGVSCPASSILVEDSNTCERGTGAGHVVQDSDTIECGTGAEQGELSEVSVCSTCTSGTNLNQDSETERKTNADKNFSSVVWESENTGTNEKGQYAADANDSDIDNSARNATPDKDEEISEDEFEDFATFEVGLCYKSKDEASDTSWASFPVSADSFMDEEKAASDEDNDDEVRQECCSSPEDKDDVIPAERTITESDFGDMDSFSDVKSSVPNSERAVESEVNDIEEKPQQNIGEDADDEFGDFGDFSSKSLVSNSAAEVQAARPTKVGQQETVFEFAAFGTKDTQDTANNDNLAAFSSGSSTTSATSSDVGALGPSAGSKFRSASESKKMDEDDEEDQAAFSRYQPHSPSMVSSSSFNMLVTAEPTSQNQTKLGRVKQAVVGCFPSGVCLTNEDALQRLDHCVNSRITESYRPYIWCSIKDLDNTDALLYHWSESTWNRQLFSTLKIDTRNILFGKKKQSYVPLTPLEPTKILTPTVVKSEDTFKPDPTQITTQEIPPAQFDWSSSGLVNPLGGANNNLNLDFLIQDSEAINKSSALESEFLVENPPSITKPTLQPLVNILANMKATSTFKQTSQNEALSQEAQRILQSLPDLAFMKEKVLMFPISNNFSD